MMNLFTKLRSMRERQRVAEATDRAEREQAFIQWSIQEARRHARGSGWMKRARVELNGG